MIRSEGELRTSHFVAAISRITPLELRSGWLGSVRDCCKLVEDILGPRRMPGYCQGRIAPLEAKQGWVSQSYHALKPYIPASYSVHPPTFVSPHWLASGLKEGFIICIFPGVQAGHNHALPFGIQHVDLLNLNGGNRISSGPSTKEPAYGGTPA